MENNNNMTPEEKFNKLLEEMKKLGNISLAEDFIKSEANKVPENTDDLFNMMSKFGKERIKEAGEFVKKMKNAASPSGTVTGECTKKAEKPQAEEKKSTPDKDEMLELIYNAYRKNEETTKIELLVKELTASITDDERLGICCCIEKAAEAEMKKAFIAGFEAAKELLK